MLFEEGTLYHILGSLAYSSVSDEIIQHCVLGSSSKGSLIGLVEMAFVSLQDHIVNVFYLQKNLSYFSPFLIMNGIAILIVFWHIYPL
jgi:hypothetical protein